ncbi:MAG: AAA family ATPase, partial [Clostridia bacterium]|nr:AAA family ATPase [Clostridia bacterium]
MKLNKIYISAFGKLKDFTLELSDGLNVIYGENENGKSTVMAFIKMMFYGSGKSTQNLAKSPRRKYAPWDGSQPAGSIEFEHSGRHYRLERTFGSSNSSDKVFLCDLDLGTRSSVSPDIGNEFFSLSMPAFERSVFIEGAGSFDNSSEADGEINSKLSNLAASGDENVSYAKILKRLDDARFALIGKSGRTGEYIKLNSTLDELKISLNTALQKKEDAKAIKEKIDALAKEIASLEAKAQDFKKIVDSESDIKNAGKLKEMLSLKQRLDEINKSLLLNDGNIADEMFANKLVFCISKIENAQQKISDKTKECETLKETIELAQNPDTEISPENAQKTELQLNKAISEAENYTLLCEQKKKEIEDLSALKEKQKSKKKAFNTPTLILAVLSLV